METYLIHHGIKGQRWGVRRYQNADGSLTNAGRKHYSEEHKQIAMQKGDIKFAKTHKDKFSNQELNKVLERYNVEKRLNQSMSEIKANGVVGRGRKKVKAILGVMAGVSSAYLISKAFVKNGKEMLALLDKIPKDTIKKSASAGLKFGRKYIDL